MADASYIRKWKFFSEELNISLHIIIYCYAIAVLCDCDLTMLALFSFETSTISLWVLYDLACHPEVQDKMYEEVSSLAGPHGDFTPTTFLKLKYVKACIKESLR